MNIMKEMTAGPMVDNIHRKPAGFLGVGMAFPAGEEPCAMKDDQGCGSSISEDVGSRSNKAIDSTCEVCGNMLITPAPRKR